MFAYALTHAYRGSFWSLVTTMTGVVTLMYININTMVVDYNYWNNLKCQCVPFWCPGLFILALDNNCRWYVCAILEFLLMKWDNTRCRFCPIWRIILHTAKSIFIKTYYIELPTTFAQIGNATQRDGPKFGIYLLRIQAIVIVLFLFITDENFDFDDCSITYKSLFILQITLSSINGYIEVICDCLQCSEETNFHFPDSIMWILCMLWAGSQRGICENVPWTAMVQGTI